MGKLKNRLKGKVIRLYILKVSTPHLASAFKGVNNLEFIAYMKQRDIKICRPSNDGKFWILAFETQDKMLKCYENLKERFGIDGVYIPDGVNILKNGVLYTELPYEFLETEEKKNDNKSRYLHHVAWKTYKERFFRRVSRLSRWLYDAEIRS